MFRTWYLTAPSDVLRRDAIWARVRPCRIQCRTRPPGGGGGGGVGGGGGAGRARGRPPPLCRREHVVVPGSAPATADHGREGSPTPPAFPYPLDSAAGPESGGERRAVSSRTSRDVRRPSRRGRC